MEKVCKIGPKSLRKNFRLNKFSKREMLLVISRVEKFSYVNTETR